MNRDITDGVVNEAIADRAVDAVPYALGPCVCGCG